MIRALQPPLPQSAAPDASQPRSGAGRPVLWDTGLLVLRGDDRDGLRRAVQETARELEAQPEADLAELGRCCNSRLQPAGARLALVAGSPADLLRRLEQAASRLGDPA